MKSALEGFNYIFTQDSNSETLLKSINLNNVSVSGDTRFDRVYNQLSLDNTVPFIETFKNKEICVVFGSTWPADDKLYLDFINSSTDNTKYIIAPHNIKSSYITSLTSQIKQNVVCFSNMKEKDLSKFKVFILDTIGYLSKVYAYADIAYVGGATGTTGLHNILEPATFGIPIIIGKNHSKFPEAKTLINIGGVLSVASSNAFENSLQALISNQTIREDKGILNKAFVEENKGAVIQILNNIRI
jgi:3-deoxy-D-manno-octulosonic-acid transferase